jgi:hypothetical protein
MLLGGALPILAQTGGRAVTDASNARLAEQRSVAREMRPSTFGTTDYTILQLPSAAFQLKDSTVGFGTLLDTLYTYTFTPGAERGTLFAPVNLPNGSLVSFLDLYYDDENAALDAEATLFELTGTTTPAKTSVATVKSSGSAGTGYNFHLIDPPLQIDNNNQYVVQVVLSDGAISLLSVASRSHEARASNPQSVDSYDGTAAGRLPRGRRAATTSGWEMSTSW